MSMNDWAKNEIEIACKKERGDSKDDGWNYGVACYKSALKAYKSLCEDGHSGMSIAITKNILNKLIEGKPLTPIEDTDDVWNLTWSSEGVDYKRDNFKYKYQCKRMSALFKSIYEDGTIKYSDVDRVRVYDLDSPDIPYSNGLIRKIVEEKYPIEMPYYPVGTYEVYCETFLTNPKNGDFDTKGILYMIKPDGEKEEINKFFHETYDEMKEITLDDYNALKLIAKNRKGE